VNPDVAGTNPGDLSPRAPRPRADDSAAETLPLPPIKRAGRWRRRWPLLVVLVWAGLAAVNITLFGVGSGAPKAGAARTTARPHIAATAAGPAMSTPPSTPSPSSQPTLAVQILVPASAAAYGPAGAGSGDNTSSADNAIDGNGAAAWETDWYNSAAFGNLQAGTGLLIDMGRPVTVTSVRITLGSIPGADLQLLTGDTPVQSQMLVQASASDAGGAVNLDLTHPEPGRYLLIWFTLLPPDSTGTFQAAVYDVRIEGTP
jgi:hypothetical protein